MALRDLRNQGLLVPQALWGDAPISTEGGDGSALATAAIGLASALLIWFGDGGPYTFAGLGLFFGDLVLFLVLGFTAVDRQVQTLLNLGLGGKVEGLELESDAEP